MNFRHWAAAAAVIVLLGLAVVGCKRKSHSGGSSSESSSTSSGSSSPAPAPAPVDTPPDTSTRSKPMTPPPMNGTEALIVPPDLKKAFYFAALTPNGILHRTDSCIWGDVGYSLEGSGDEFGFGGLYSSSYGFTDGYPSYPDASSPSYKGVVYGSRHDDDTAYSDAKTDASATYTDLAGRTGATTLAAELSGTSPAPGVYKFTTNATLTGGTLTLSGTASDIWIFQVPGDLLVTGAAKVVMAGGAVNSNVWWQVGAGSDYAHFGALIGDDPRWGGPDPAGTGYALFQGTIVSQGGLGIGRGSTLIGRALAVGPYYRTSGSPVGPYGYPSFMGEYMNYYPPSYTYTGLGPGYGVWCSLIVYGNLSILPTKDPNLGAANAFGALAKTAITTTPVTTVGGSVGVSSGTGSAPTGLTVDDVSPGTLYLTPGDPTVVTAMTATTATGADLNSRNADYDMSSASMSGRILPGGTYLINSSTSFTGTITLDGRNDSSSRWIFVGGDSTTLTVSSVTFAYTRGAKFSDVYWRVGGVSLSSGAKLKGTVVSGAGTVTMGSGSEVQGRVFSLTSSITMTSATIYKEPSGQPVTGFTTLGADPNAALDDEARSVATDGSNMYVFGFRDGLGAGVNNQWRLEKRSLSDGSLVAGFGTGGAIEWNPGTGNDIPRRILCNAAHTYLYLVGSRETGLGTGLYGWRVERRRVSDGALLPNGADPVFGTAGIISGAFSGQANDIAIDATSLYVIGDQIDAETGGFFPPAGGLAHRTRVEKRGLTSGALDTSFDGDGIYTAKYLEALGWGAGDYPAIIESCANSITLTADSLIVTGWVFDNNLLATAGKDTMFLKLSSTSGAPDLSSNWGDGGAGEPFLDGTNYADLSSGFGDDMGGSVVNDGSYFYSLVAWSSDVSVKQWSILKRPIVSGAGAAAYAAPATSGPFTDTLSDFTCGQIEIHGGAIYVAANNIVSSDKRWRIEKRATADLALVVGFNSTGPTPGVVEINPTGIDDKVFGIVYDGGILYSVGSENSSATTGRWHYSALTR